MRIEVRTALAAADGKTGQGVLEDLLKAQEFQDALVYGRVETKASLVRSDRRIELDSVAEVYMIDTGIICPRHAEGDDPFGFGDPFQKAHFPVGVFIGVYDGSDRIQNALCSFKELRLIGVLFLQSCINFRNIRHSFLPPIACFAGQAAPCTLVCINVYKKNYIESYMDVQAVFW